MNIIAGRMLKQLRKDNKMTMYNAATSVHKSKRWLSNIEAGRCAVTFRDVYNLCQSYGISFEEFARTFEENMNEKE